ncbi:hypothetical protein DV737_g5610, partial [Chaetothyriales sp. CBS 132003]
MRAASLLSRGILLLLCAITVSYEFISSKPQSIKPLCTIFYDPRTLRYKLSSWTPPATDELTSTGSEAAHAPLVRILLPNGSSTVTTLATFASDLSQDITLWVSPDPDGSIFSASIGSTSPPPLTAEEERLRRKIERAKARGKPTPSAAKPKPKSKSKKKSGKDQKPAEKVEPDRLATGVPKVGVTLIPAKAGPTAKLGSRAPPQLDADGNEILQKQEQEKTFFQKYWWVFLAASLLALGSGGGEK